MHTFLNFRLNLRLMKKTLLLATLLLSSLYNVVAQPTLGLIAHWPFSGNANDISGNGHHGNLHNVTPTAGQQGIANTAYLLNGTNSFISIPYSSGLNTNYISICAVVKPTAFYSGTCEGNYILTRGTVAISASPGSYMLGIFDNAYNSCGVLDTNYEVATGHLTATGIAPGLWQSSTRIHTNNWYCLVETFDGTYARIYVNGTLAITTTGWASTIGTSTDSIAIGKYLAGSLSGYPYNFTGVIDDVAIYNRPLTVSEVADYCNSVMVPDTIVYISQPLNKTAFCPGDTVHVNYSVNVNFNTGNIFTAELSNSSGSFTSPVSIGTLTSSVPGKIICTIPAGTPAGTGYRIRVRSSNPVRTSADNGVNLAVNPKPTPVLTNNSPVCAGDTIKLSATYVSGTFNWSGPGSYTFIGASVKRPNATPAIGGTYTVITTAAGCKDTSTLNVTVNAKPTPVTINNSPVCEGDSIKLGSTYGGATFNWFGPGTYTNTGGSVIRPNATTAMSGTYTVVSTANGCVDTTNLNVVVVTKPAPLLTNNSPVCAGDSIKLSASYGSATFTWSGPGGYNYTGANVIRPNATSSMAGKYTIVTVLGVCRDTSNLTVVVNPTPVVNITGNINICDGDSLHLKSTSSPAASSYSWNWPGGSSVQQNIDIANAVAGTYMVKASNGNCIGKDSVNVQVTQMNVDLGKDQNLCNVNLPVLSPGIAGASYLWQDGSTASTFAVPGSGKYYVTVTLNGCKRSDTVNIKALYVGVDIGDDTSLCEGDTLKLSAQDGFDKYAWSTGTTGKSIVIKEQGRYWVRVLKDYCDAFDTVNVSYLDGRLYLPEDTTLCNGEIIQLEVASIDGSEYRWQDGAGGNKYTVEKGGYYWVNATNQCGSFGDTVWVEYEECNCKPVVPTAFSPNGDDRNDYLHPFIYCTPKSYKFMILNRWGEVVFRSQNVADKWDGSYKGVPAEVGAYFYYLEVMGPNGHIFREKGDITLVH